MASNHRIRVLNALVLLAFALTSALTLGCGGDEAQQHVERAAELMEQRDWEAAIVELDQAIELDPESAVAYTARADAYGELGRLADALSDLDRAIELDPEYTPAYNNRALAKVVLGDLEGALADANRAVELDPEAALPYNTRGVVYNELGRFAEALPDLNRAIELDPKLAPAYSNRAVTKAELRDPQGALLDASQAIELDTSLANAYTNRGYVYIELGRFADALPDLDRAIELDPNLAIAYCNRAVAKATLGDPKGALGDADRAIELAPELALAYTVRGYVYNELGRFADALPDLDRAIELAPMLAPAYNDRGVSYLALGDMPQAIADFDRAIALDAGDVLTYLNRAFAHATMGNMEAALSDYETALSLAEEPWLRREIQESTNALQATATVYESPYESFHYRVAFEFHVGTAAGESETPFSGLVEGDFVSPQSHAFRNSITFGSLTITNDAVILGPQAWTRVGTGPWSKTAVLALSIDVTSLSSADPQFWVFNSQLSADLSTVAGASENLDGLHTNRYSFSRESVGALAPALTEGFLTDIDLSSLNDFEMTVWVDTITRALMRFELTYSGSPEAIGEIGLEIAPDSLVTVSLNMTLTQINDPRITVDAPTD